MGQSKVIEVPLWCIGIAFVVGIVLGHFEGEALGAHNENQRLTKLGQDVVDRRHPFRKALGKS